MQIMDTTDSGAVVLRIVSGRPGRPPASLFATGVPGVSAEASRRAFMAASSRASAEARFGVTASGACAAAVSTDVSEHPKTPVACACRLGGRNFMEPYRVLRRSPIRFLLDRLSAIDIEQRAHVAQSIAAMPAGCR
jgi:hypothetical protein